MNTSRIQNPDIRTTGGSRRGAARRSGTVRQSGAGQDGTATGRFAQETTVPPAPQGFQGIENNNPELLFGSTNKKSYVNRMEEQHQRLTTGLSAVYPRDDGRSSFLAADQETDGDLSL